MTYLCVLAVWPALSSSTRWRMWVMYFITIQLHEGVGANGEPFTSSSARAS